jgi:hypothetical protein
MFDTPFNPIRPACQRRIEGRGKLAPTVRCNPPCGTSLTKDQNLTYNEYTRVDYTSKYLGQARNVIEKASLE